jgi:plastocyanin
MRVPRTRAGRRDIFEGFRRHAFAAGAMGFAAAALLGSALLAAAQLGPGIPADLAAYRHWTKMNGHLLDDPSNPRALPKNTFVNLSPDRLAALYRADGGVTGHYPDGAVLVRETLDSSGFVRALFVMRYDHTADRTKGWVYSGYTRTAADKPFTPAEIADPVTRCVNCHAQVSRADYVFTPYTNRTLPVPAPTRPAHVEARNYQFGPQALHVKAGAAVTFVNYDVVPHDVKAADRSFESGNIPPFGNYTVTVTKPGTLAYFCAVHLGMRGTMIVEP